MRLDWGSVHEGSTLPMETGRERGREREEGRERGSERADGRERGREREQERGRVTVGGRG